MTVRAGMANLITSLREQTFAGTADFALAGANYFSDQHLQDYLDGHATLLEWQPVRWLADTTDAATLEYHRAAIGFRDLEEANSGTVNWALRDSTGVLLGGTAAGGGTPNYAVDYIGGYVRFSADQGGSAYYLTARSYDLSAAAADVWRRRMAYYSNWYSFSSDSQRYERQQAFEHAKVMVGELTGEVGQNTQRGDLRSSVFVRTDVNRSESDQGISDHPNRPTTRGW